MTNGVHLQSFAGTLRHSSRRAVTGALLLLALNPAALCARSIVEAGNTTVWKYLDDGKEPPVAWREADFDDSGWKFGRAPLGYGRTGLSTEVDWGPDKDHKFVTTWFRHAFDRPELKPGQRLVIVFCVDDGAVVYLNGRELGRENMPDGSVTAATMAPRAVGPKDEGFYLRMHVPAEALRPRRNVLAVEVHQCSPRSHDIFFDLALKTMPADVPAPAVPVAAQEVVITYNRRHYVGPGVRIPDGYEDGGRGMQLDGEGHPSSRREILLVDRRQDAELARDLAFARSPELRTLPPLERAQRLAARIHRETTPPGGMRWLMKTAGQLEKEFSDKPVFIGDWVEQGQAGVCRHRSLLFKVLADEAGLNAALVRGNYAGPISGGHAWNEIVLDDGRRLLVDIMQKGERQDFPEVTSPAVARQYLRVDNTPWYEAKAGR